ncbi:hypothetical protein BJF88_16840 [Cellulosimicrobium sp. CUA-896]|nr:hypothetical protein BJF88_16840 [Cellulosimicrobium sp. CUA-896]
MLGCLGVGLVAGAATARTWDVPGLSDGMVPAAAVLADAVPGAVAGEGDAEARSKATASRSTRARDPLALPFTVPTAQPSPRPSDPVPLAPTAPPVDVPQAPEVPPTTAPPAPEPPAAEPGSGLLGTEVVPDLGGAFAVVPGEAPAPARARCARSGWRSRRACPSTARCSPRRCSPRSTTRAAGARRTA